MPFNVIYPRVSDNFLNFIEDILQPDRSRLDASLKLFYNFPLATFKYVRFLLYLKHALLRLVRLVLASVTQHLHLFGQNLYQTVCGDILLQVTALSKMIFSLITFS